MKKKERWKKEDTIEGKKEKEGAITPPTEVTNKFTKSMETGDRQQEQDLEALNAILQLSLWLMRTFSEATLFAELGLQYQCSICGDLSNHREC